MQADPMRPTLNASECKRLQSKYDVLLSNVAFSFNMRRYSEVVKLTG